jgi:hypothetical protein
MASCRCTGPVRSRTRATILPRSSIIGIYRLRALHLFALQTIAIACAVCKGYVLVVVLPNTRVHGLAWSARTMRVQA